MITALDTNVLTALWDDTDALNIKAFSALELAFSNGGIVICGAVFAELLACPGRSEEFLNNFLMESRISIDWRISKEIWLTAGQAYSAYAERRRKARHELPRRILADFLIGAHALENKYTLLTLDDKIFRAAFPELQFAEKI